MHTLTVFTPTYNRRAYLIKCYESLVKQTDKDFIWQVVDDGSTDGTGELIKGFMAEGLIDIEYHYQENGGKASAMNYSLKRVETPYWVCLDSDDYLFPDAVRIVNREMKRIDRQEDICGVFCVRSNAEGKPMKGIDVPPSVTDATQWEIRYKLRVPTEYVQVYKSSIVKGFTFLIHPGERYMALSWMQDQLDCKYKFHVIHEPIMVCAYLDDGLTRNYYRLMCRYPKGFRDFYAQRLKICPYLERRLWAAMMYNAVYGLTDDPSTPKLKHPLVLLTALPGWAYRHVILKHGAVGK